MEITYSITSPAAVSVDSNSGSVTRASLEFITQTMNELAREVGMMEPDDPSWEPCLNKFFELGQLKRSLQAKFDPIGEHIDELAREMTTLKLDDPPRAQIVEEIMLSGDEVFHTLFGSL